MNIVPGARATDTVARRVAANSAWQVVSFAARAVSGLGVVVLLARSGGPSDVGVFQFALTLTTLVPAFWGFPALIGREIARKPDHARLWVESGMLVSLFIGAVLTFAFSAGAAVFGADDTLRATITLAGVAMMIEAASRILFSAFMAWEQMRYETVATAIQEGVFLAGAALAVAAGGGPQEAMVVLLVSRGFGLSIAWGIASGKLRAPLLPRPHRGFARKATGAAAPFAVSDVLKVVQIRGDVVVLGLMKGPAAVGLYQACANLVMHWNTLARSLNHAMYPRMSRAWPGHIARFGRLRDASNRALAMIGLPIAVGGAMLAGEILRALYGPSFDDAVRTLQLLALVVPIRMMSNTMSLGLAAADRQSARMVAVGCAATANIALNFALIPSLSYLGSAIATLVTETMLLATYAILLRRVAGPARLGYALRLPGLASLPMAAAMLATSGGPLYVPVAAGGCTYLAALALAAYASPERRGRSPIASFIGLVRPT